MRPLGAEDPSSIARHLAERSVVSVESTIPADMTVLQWRRQRSASRRRARRRSLRVVAVARRVVPLRPVACDHLCETTTRYDPVAKQLSFLLVCEVCGTEKVVETVPYEPRFEQPVPRAA